MQQDRIITNYYNNDKLYEHKQNTQYMVKQSP